MSDESTEINIAAPTRADKVGWRKLYYGYAEFYKVPMSEEVIDRVWDWLHNPREPLEGLVAKDGAGDVIGLAHFRAMPRPLTGTTAGFLDDLFVAPAARGTSVGDALLYAVAAVCRKRGWTVLRWITQDDNYRARAVYDRHARRTMWLTYEIDLSSG